MEFLNWVAEHWVLTVTLAVIARGGVNAVITGFVAAATGAAMGKGR